MQLGIFQYILNIGLMSIRLSISIESLNSIYIAYINYIFVSGILLSGYITALGVGALVLPLDVAQYVTMIEGLNLSSATLFIAKACLAAPVGYHFANGIRHLYWDTARGLTIKEVYSTGYAMLAATVAITLFLAAL